MNSSSSDNHVTIYVNGTPLKVRAGIPVGAALYEKRIYGFHKSFKYNRLRGLFVFDWWGPERIGIKDGLEKNPYLLKTQEGLRLNCECNIGLIPRIVWMFRRYFEVGFYNNSFFRSSFGWWIMKNMLNKILPYYYPPFEKSPPKSYLPPVEINADVLIIGGGLAGLSAALASSSYGAKTVVIEADEKLGGYTRLLSISLSSETKEISIDKLIEKLIKSNVHILTNIVFQGFLDDAVVGTDLSTGRIILFKAKSIVLATGSREIPALFENNDLPGIMLASGVLRLIRDHMVKPGKRGLVMGFSDLGLRTAIELKKNGIEVILVDKGKLPENELVSIAKESGVELLDEVEGLKAVGGVKVEKTIMWGDIGSKIYNVDFIAMAPYTNSSLELPGQLQLKMVFDSRLGGFIPLHSIDGSTEKEDVFIAGSLGGIIPVEACYYLSQVVGFKAASYSNSHSFDEDYEHSISKGIKVFHEADPERFRAYKKLVDSYESDDVYSYLNDNDVTTWYKGDSSTQFICGCADVTVADLIRMYKEVGMWRMELIKRYSGLGTGACQGRGCVFNTVVIISKLSGKDPLEIGRFRSRFPVIPINLESLAGVKI